MAVCAPAAAAERRSWTKIRYAGGTLAIQTSPYDYNTKLTVSLNPDQISLEIAPAKLFSSAARVRFKPSQVISLSVGPLARRRVADVPGAQTPAAPPSLFGILHEESFIGIVWEDDAGKRQAVLLDTIFGWRFLPILRELSGKDVEGPR